MRLAAETPGRFQASFVNDIESSLINAQRDRPPPYFLPSSRQALLLPESPKRCSKPPSWPANTGIGGFPRSRGAPNASLHACSDPGERKRVSAKIEGRCLNYGANPAVTAKTSSEFSAAHFPAVFKLAAPLPLDK